MTAYPSTLCVHTCLPAQRHGDLGAMLMTADPHLPSTLTLTPPIQRHGDLGAMLVTADGAVDTSMDPNRQASSNRGEGGAGRGGRVQRPLFGPQQAGKW